MSALVTSFSISFLKEMNHFDMELWTEIAILSHLRKHPAIPNFRAGSHLWIPYIFIIESQESAVIRDYAKHY